MKTTPWQTKNRGKLKAYEEVREDRHPILFISGRDISEILIANGFNTVERVTALLASEFEV